MDAAAPDAPRADRPRTASGRRRAAIAEAGGEAGLVAYFKERVYASFTGLAIVMVVSQHPDDPAHAFLALVLGVVGIVTAGFVADIVGHLAVHRRFSSAGEVVVPLRVALGALGTLVIPAAVVGAAWIGWMPPEVALAIAAWSYVLTLAVIGALVVRRAQLRWWQSLMAVGLLVALALLVLLLQTLAKSV